LAPDVDSVEPMVSIMYIRKSVHFIEPHASWVQIDANQFGLYYLGLKSESKMSTQGLGLGVCKRV